MSGLRSGRVRVRVPATSANLGPGFDCFGLALMLHDEVEASAATDGGAAGADGSFDTGVAITVEGEGADDVPRTHEHLVARSALLALARLGAHPGSLRLHCINRIPHGRGLGSSAAAICAGVLAARALVDDGEARLDDEAVFALATDIEGHPDNVAACLYGGFTLAWAERGGPRAVSLTPAAAVVPLVLIPAEQLPTHQARALLPAQVPHDDAAWTAARAALLVEALTRRPDLLFAATDDRLHQTYRASAMPATADVLRRLRDRGIAAVVSGAGPTVLAFASDATAAAVGETAPPGWRVERLAVDVSGAEVEPVEADDQPEGSE